MATPSSPVASTEALDINEDSVLETAFSRFAQDVVPRARKRAAYGGAKDNAAEQQQQQPDDIMNSKDLLEDAQPVNEVSLFSSLNDDDESPSDSNPESEDEDRDSCEQDDSPLAPSEQASNMEDDDDEANDEESSDNEQQGRTKRSFCSTPPKESDDDVSSDEETVDMNAEVELEYAETVKQGRTKRSFRTTPPKESKDDDSCGQGPHDDGDKPTEANDESKEESSPVALEESNALVSNDQDDGKEKEAPEKEDTMNAPKDDTPKEQPDKESLILSIDNLFVHADKESVTVGDIVRSLEAEYDVKFEKATRAVVRSHLTDLIKGIVEPTVPDVESEEEEEEESVSGDFESESSEYEDEQEVKKEKKPRRPSAKKPRQPKKRTSSRQKPPKKPSHLRIHADMLRKRRIEELRVRNEELQVKQSKEDQKRAELIAAKFETNTEELRLKRLEDRLDLLQKLDQKRIRVISIEVDDKENEPPSEGGMKSKERDEAPSSTPTEDSDSEDDMELEIVGKDIPLSSQFPTNFAKVAPSGHPTKSSAISMLDMVCRLKPSEKRKKAKRDGPLSLSADQPQASPGKSMTARATLRNALLAKQRKAGNMWLARELGYKTQEEHLKDCKLVESKKREDIMKKEEERLCANERKKLRERMLTETDIYEAEEEALGDGDPSAEASNGDGDDGDESDEEMAMAREIEDEQRDGENTSDMPTSSAEVSTKQIEEQHQSDDDHEVDVSEDDLQSRGESSKEALESEGDIALSSPADSPNVLAESKHGEGPADGDTTPEGDSSMDTAVNNKENMVPPEDALVQPEHDAPASDSETGLGPEDHPNTGNDNQPSSEKAVDDDEEENEFQEESQEVDADDESTNDKPAKEKNSVWKAMLQKEAEKIKKMKARKGGNGLVEAEADEEEEEEAVTGLEDFGFSLHNKKKNADDEDEDLEADKLTEEDMKHVVDDVSDDEGDEEAGAVARQELNQQEEKERHKEIIRRMREGYDGRRGGIAGSGVGARGIHRFDQLVAADNRDDAKRLGLLNDDEFDSDDDGGNGDGDNKDDEIEDETALLDKMLKDRFLHRSSNEVVEENFSDDEAEEDDLANGT